MSDPTPIELPTICSPETVGRIRAGEPVVIWVREKFACRQDDHLVRVRYAADGPTGPAKTVNTVDVPARFHSRTCCTHPARYMPRVFSRLVFPAVLETEGEG